MSNIKKFALIFCFAIVSGCLLLNTSFGRILKGTSKNISMIVDNSEKSVVLLDIETDENGKYKPLNSEFKNGKIDFYVSNGTADKYAKYNLKAYLLVFVSESFGDAYDEITKKDLLKVKLIYDNKVLVGTREDLNDDNYGIGYIYHFCNEDGKDIFIDLPGNIFSKERIRIEIEGIQSFDTEVKIIAKGMLNE